MRGLWFAWTMLLLIGAWVVPLMWPTMIGAGFALLLASAALAPVTYARYYSIRMARLMRGGVLFIAVCGFVVIALGLLIG
jgi:hypothetical protein